MKANTILTTPARRVQLANIRENKGVAVCVCVVGALAVSVCIRACVGSGVAVCVAGDVGGLMVTCSVHVHFIARI